jgi:hypothetical protein
VPPRIKVFLWQLIRSRLPSNDQVARRRGPFDSLCSLCEEPEDCNHIFFACHLARFMWEGARELLGTVWNPAGAGNFIALAQGLAGPLCRIVWFTFAAQCWALWNIRNKLTIEGKLIGHPAIFIFQMSLHMQCRRGLVRPRDRALLDEVLREVMRLHARAWA